MSAKNDITSAVARLGVLADASDDAATSSGDAEMKVHSDNKNLIGVSQTTGATGHAVCSECKVVRQRAMHSDEAEGSAQW